MSLDQFQYNESDRASGWTEGAIVYQIYPRSLQDTNGDGIGDLPGVIKRLDYIKDLGINAIWLSPFYPSPMADFGYDVSDYCDVNPIFGTLDDFKELLDESRKRNLKVIIDLVPNHTSDEHEWFRQSRQSKDNAFSEWYIWKDAHPTSPDEHRLPPNNWRDALTGGSAWEWEPKRQQFYLHSFDVRQPDLKWSNPAVRDAIKDVMRFWLDLGVDGFRVDAVYWMAKEPQLRDDTVNPDYVEGEDQLYDAVMHDNSRGFPGVYAYLSGMAEVLKEEKYNQKQRFIVTEAYPERHNYVSEYLKFYESMDPRVAAPFNFEGVSLEWKADDWHRFLKSFHTKLDELSPDCIASYAFGNHDTQRLASRIGVEAARSAAVMLLTLPGMAFIYYGEEIGMHDVEIPKEYVQDPAAKNDPRHGIGRDPERTPMLWSSDKHAGFSTADKTWLPVSPNYESINVETQLKDANSSLLLYRTLGVLRNNSPALKSGGIQILDIEQDNILGYVRTSAEPGSKDYIVVINFSDGAVTCRLDVDAEKLILSSDPQTSTAEAANEVVELRPYEAKIFSVRK